MSSSDLARDPNDLVAATVDPRIGVIEYAILGPEFIDRREPTRGIVFRVYRETSRRLRVSKVDMLWVAFIIQNASGSFPQEIVV